MQHRFLGSTGIEVSHLALGTLTWGRDTSQAQAQDMIRTFLDGGGNVLHTSALFGSGQAQSVLGAIFDDFLNRDECVVIAKGGFLRRGERWQVSNSRTGVLSSIDRTLRDLGTDYLDVFVLEDFDPHTATEETLAGLDIALRSGKVRALGIANFGPWRSAQLLTRGQLAGVPIHAMEAPYSLLERGVEDQVLAPLSEGGHGFIATSALAGGALTGKYRHGTPPDSRAASPLLAPSVVPYLQPNYQPILEALGRAANGLDVPAYAVALGWLRAQTAVTCAVVGPRTDTQLRQLLEFADTELPLPLVEALNDARVTD